MQGSGRCTNLDDHVLECAWQQQSRAQQVGPVPGWLTQFQECCLSIIGSLWRLPSLQRQLLNAAVWRAGCILVADRGSQSAECGCGKPCESNSLRPASAQSSGPLGTGFLRCWPHSGEQAWQSIRVSVRKSIGMVLALVTCTDHLQRCPDSPVCVD